MRAVKPRGGGFELRVRRLLWRAGLRGWRLARDDLPGKPDIVFARAKVAVFCHGCFWHGHDCPRGARVPKRNADYWIAKIARNRARDERTQERLRTLGWTCAVVWECETDQAIVSRLSSLIALGRPANPHG